MLQCLLVQYAPHHLRFREIANMPDDPSSVASLPAFHHNLVGVTALADANARLAEVDRFFAVTNGPTWRGVRRGDAWMTVAFAATTDPWSIIRKKASSEYARLIASVAFTEDAIPLPLSKLLALFKDTKGSLHPPTLWYVIEGALRLVGDLLRYHRLRELFGGEQWERVSVPVLQRLLKPCRAHPQLPIRTMSSQLVVQYVVEVAPLVVGMEHLQLILDCLSNDLVECLTADASPDSVSRAEGCLTLLLDFVGRQTMPREMGCILAGFVASNRSLFSRGALHPAATVRFSVAELMCADTTETLFTEWKMAVLDGNDNVQEFMWRAIETYFVAVSAHLKRVGTMQLTIHEDALVDVLVLAAALSASDLKDRAFEVQRAVTQAIPLLCNATVVTALPSRLQIAKETIRGSKLTMYALAWSVAILNRLAAHRLRCESLLAGPSSGRKRSSRRLQLLKVPTEWRQFVQDVAPNAVTAVVFSSYGIIGDDHQSSTGATDSGAWNTAFKESPRTVLDVLAFAQTVVQQGLPSMTEAVSEIVAHSWVPKLLDDGANEHEQCILCDALLCLLSGESTPKGEGHGGNYPFPHLQHADFKPSCVEDGGSDMSDGTSWIQWALGQMPKLEVEDRSRAPQQPPCTITNLLTDSAVELIASAVRSVVSNRGTEPVVLDHIGALAACISTNWSSAVPEGASFGVTVFIERLSKLFPNFRDDAANDDSTDNWDDDDAGDEEEEIAAGITVGEEVSRVRRQIELVPSSVLQVGGGPLEMDFRWFVCTDSDRGEKLMRGRASSSKQHHPCGSVDSL